MEGRTRSDVPDGPSSPLRRGDAVFSELTELARSRELMFSSIALTTDFSERSRASFDTAAALARRFGARLHLVHVVGTPEICTPWQISEDPSAEAGRCLDEARQRLEELSRTEPAFEGLAVTTRTLTGSLSPALRSFQRDESLDLLVVASSGHTAEDSCLIGGFTSKVLRILSCPVLVYSPSERTLREGDDRPFEASRIVVPHDFSRASASGLDLATVWAREFGAAVRLVFVVEPLASTYGYLAESGGSVSDYVARIRSEGLAELERLIERRWRNIPTEAVACVGHPATEILRTAREFHADLIIMPSRGLSIPDRLDLGSVAEQTLRGANCPVLIVKQAQTAVALLP